MEQGAQEVTNEILQWFAIFSIGFLVIYPLAHNIVEDFKKAEEEE